MLGLQDILLEGRVEDARQYIAKAIGTEMLSDESEEVLGYFIDGDPSGNHKYLMWMVKMHDIDSGFSPNMLIDLVGRFHNNLDKIHPALILQHGDLGMYSGSRIATSPKNIDSYPDYRSLKGVVEAAEESVTRKQKETEAKSGVDKLYEDERWLLVKPNTYEGSCYYGSSTKWCTASREAPHHFQDYSKDGNLFYIIDKSKDLGDFYKIALYKKFSDGSEEWYDRADNELSNQTEDAIYSMLPEGLVSAFVNAHEEYEPPKPGLKSLEQFSKELREVIYKNPKLGKINTQSGTYHLYIDQRDGTWMWTNIQNTDLAIYATPLWDGELALPISSADVNGDIDYNVVFQADSLENAGLKPEHYLSEEPGRYRHEDWGAKIFLHQFYLPLVKGTLDQSIFQEAAGHEFKTWNPQSHVSTYTFKYPPREGTMTKKFIDYLKQNPRKTANEFYEDVLGYSRPRAHNNMFFAAIKDAGIVKLERQGRQFVYSLGPNYQDWVEGRLLRN
jgi:hypothetical protein